MEEESYEKIALWKKTYSERFSSLMCQEIAYLSKLAITMAEANVTSENDRFEQIIDMTYIARQLASMGRDLNDLLGLTALEIEQMEEMEKKDA